MKKLVLSVLVSFGLAGFAQAGGDAEAGKTKAASCMGCHGMDGNSVVPIFPKLAGQNERYLIKQMNDIQCGALSADEQKQSKCSPRVVAAMAGQLNGKSAQDLADIAAYFAAQPAKAGVAADVALAAKGEQVYRAGIQDKAVAACVACHSPTGQGNAAAGYPALAGQHSGYITAQLKAFRAAADGKPGRSNDGDISMMRDVAKNLSDSEIEAVASFIAGLN